MDREGETTGLTHHSVDRGLYVLRYVSSPTNPTPIAAIGVIRGLVGFLSAPGRERAELARPGQALVVIARSAGVFEIKLHPSTPGKILKAHFALNLLDGGDKPGFASGQAAQMETYPPFELEAHLGRLGISRVRSGEWIAGPNNPLPIKGLTIVGSEATEMLIQVRLMNQLDRWSRWYGVGQTVETCDQSAPLSGIRFKLVRPEGRMIVCEALFLGHALIRRAGSEIEFSGNDPLIGLKVDLVDAVVDRSGGSMAASRPVRVFAAVN